MRLLGSLLLSYLVLIVPLLFGTQEVAGGLGWNCCLIRVDTSTGGGAVNFNKTWWPDASQNWTITVTSGAYVYCQTLPQKTPFNITAFEPKGYPFLRWDSGPWIKIGNSTSNPTNITLAACGISRITAVFNGPATSIPTGLTLLGIMIAATIAAWGRKKKLTENMRNS